MILCTEGYGKIYVKIEWNSMKNRYGVKGVRSKVKGIGFLNQVQGIGQENGMGIKKRYKVQGEGAMYQGSD